MQRTVGRLPPGAKDVSMEAKWDEMRQMLTLPERGIPRAEWRRRFLDEMVRLTGCSELVAEGEIEVWPEQDGDAYPDWLTTTPEDAVAENLSYWTDDE